MTTHKDLILVNSFAPRHRIACDATLENGLALIRTHLEDQGFAVDVIDGLRVNSVEKGVPRWCLWVLKVLVGLQMMFHGKSLKYPAYICMLLAWPFHSYSIFCRRKDMDRLIDKIVEEVKISGAKMAGIKVWNGEAYTWSGKLAQRIRRECPETVVVAGGPQVKVYAELILEKKDFDLAVMGPGEEFMAYLLHKQRQTATKADFLALVHREIPTAPFIRTGSYCEQSDFMFNTFVAPRYRASDLEDKIAMHTIVDGLSCTWKKCNFCSHTRQTINYTPRPVVQIKEEILGMIRQGISFFRFSSSDTPLSQGRAIAEMLLAADIKINYSMFFRSGKNPRKIYEVFCLMIRSGLRAVYIGAESGHDVILKEVMNKGLMRQDIIETVKCIKQAAIDVGLPCQIALSFIYPCPVVEGVTLADVLRETVSLIEETMPDTVIVNPPVVLPGTIWYEKSEQFGFKVDLERMKRFMSFEYSLYKPYEFWPEFPWSLNGMDSGAMLQETAKLTQAVDKLGIPLNLPDEAMMMTKAVGYESTESLLEYKRRSLQDVMVGGCSYISELSAQVNEQSRKVAAQNH